MPFSHFEQVGADKNMETNMAHMLTPDPEPGTNGGVITWRLVWTWIQTILGVAFISALLVSALYLFGLHWGLGVAVLSLWAAVPLLGWYFSANIVRVMT